MPREFEGQPTGADLNQPVSASETNANQVGEGEQWEKIRKNILEKWQQLPPQEQGNVIAGMIEDIEERMLPVGQVAKVAGYSHWRLRDLIRSGKLVGIDFSRGKRIAGVYTTVEAVKTYRSEPSHGFKTRFLEKFRAETEGG